MTAPSGLCGLMAKHTRKAFHGGLAVSRHANTFSPLSLDAGLETAAGQAGQRRKKKGSTVTSAAAEPCPQCSAPELPALRLLLPFFLPT